ncbi:tryptophan-rich sensory protein [Candidatus Micrarchaeota archaeon]|nr:tryptophan-rich sensory protein [Candidatus Micrarchaeota archaeon]
MKNKFMLIFAILLCELAGVIGAFFTIPSIEGWYHELLKPSFSPPNWLFGPVWTVLYFLMGVSAYLVWERGIKKKNVKNSLLIFGVQLVLNILWSILFFGLQSPLLGFICIVLLWIAIAVTIIKFYRISKTAGLLQVPYLLWLTFATVLNFFIWIVN